MDFEDLNFITQNFFPDSMVLDFEILHSGSINKTFVIEYLYNGIRSKFILQCLSTIFESYEIVNMNHKLLTDHIKKIINDNCNDFAFKMWRVPYLIKCKSNNLFLFPYKSNFWRAMEYIDQTFSVDILEDKIMAYETGIGLAKFHLFCREFDRSKLGKSINNFHDTKYYLDQFNITYKNYEFYKIENKINNRIKVLINNLSIHIKYVELLIDSLKKNTITNNVIHGDPKLSNFLFDVHNKYVVSMVDLDTVSSGYLITDLADCIRSISNLTGEEPKDKENVFFDINSCMIFLKGYFSIFNKKKGNSFEFIPEFVYLIIFELAIRFLTDFLQSNKYFKIKYETQNLFRAEVQYRLLSSFLSQISNLSDELNKIGISSSSSFISDVQKFI